MQADRSNNTTTPFGPLRTARYMVNSSNEFTETVYTLNGIVGALTNPKDVEQVQKMAKFAVIPLPHSQSKFIACFDIPLDLFGGNSSRRPLLLDFQNYGDSELGTRMIQKPPHTIFSFNVRTLFEVNLALHRLESSLRASIPQQQWFRIRRSISILMKAGQQAGDPVGMVASVESGIPNLAKSASNTG